MGCFFRGSSGRNRLALASVLRHGVGRPEHPHRQGRPQARLEAQLQPPSLCEGTASALPTEGSEWTFPGTKRSPIPSVLVLEEARVLPARASVRAMRVPPPQPQPLIIEPGLFRWHEILGWIAIVAGAAVFVAALAVPVDDPAPLLVPAVLLRAGWLIFDSDRHRARVQAESTSMNKLRPLNKLRSPGHSARGGVVAKRPL